MSNFLEKECSPQTAETDTRLTTAEYARSLATLAETMPEIAYQQDRLLDVGTELLEKHGVLPSMFDSGAHCLFFTAIADRTAWLGRLDQDESTPGYLAEVEYLDKAAMLLTHKHSIYQDDYEAQIYLKKENRPSILRTEKLRHLNKEVTKELEDAIEAGLLDSTRDGLGITAGSESPYEVRVLNVGAEWATGPMNPADFELAGSAEDIASFNTYCKQLAKNSLALAVAMDNKDRSLAAAWMCKDEGNSIIYIPLPLAEMILYPNEQRSKHYYPEELQEDTLSSLQHEYVHTQGGLFIDDSVHFGLSMEELRAEAFSGDLGGYHEVKKWVNDLWIVTGIHITDYIQPLVEGGTPGDLYEMLSKHIGLQSALEISLAPPLRSLTKTMPINLAVTSHLGGHDGVTKKNIQPHDKARRRRQY